MSIDGDLTNDDLQGETIEDNRGNRIDIPEARVGNPAQIPAIKDHPYQRLTPDVVIDASSPPVGILMPEFLH